MIIFPAVDIQNGQAVQVYSTTDGYTGAASSLTNALNLANPTLQGGNAQGGAMYGLVNNPNTDAGQTVKYAVLFAAPASLDLGDAMQQVADRVDLILEDLPESNAPATPAYDYRYTVSTSVASASAPATPPPAPNLRPPIPQRPCAPRPTDQAPSRKPDPKTSPVPDQALPATAQHLIWTKAGSPAALPDINQAAQST